jgi:ABC-type lipoprotein release transport system permease subunit
MGCAAGLLIAVSLTQILDRMLYGVSRHDSVTLVSVSLLVLFVSAVASFLPAIRAARTDPMQVLREA